MTYISVRSFGGRERKKTGSRNIFYEKTFLVSALFFVRARIISLGGVRGGWIVRRNALFGEDVVARSCARMKKMNSRYYSIRNRLNYADAEIGVRSCSSLLSLLFA